MKTLVTRTGISLLAIAILLAASLCIAVYAQSTPSNQGAMEANGNQNAAQNTSNEQQGPIELVDPGKIYNENPLGWVGKSVVLKNVMVQDTNKSGNFWVGLDNSHRLLVVKQQGNANLHAIALHKGDVVTVSGTVEAASRYMAQTSSAEMGSMQDAQKGSGVFLMANDVNVNSSTQH